MGTWKGAMADFCMSMMTLFMVLWIVSITDAEQREGLSGYFSGPGSISSFTTGHSVIDFKMSVNETLGEWKPPHLEMDEYDDSAEGNLLLEESQFSNPYVVELLKIKQYQDNLRMEEVEDGLLIQLVETDDQPMFKLGEYELTYFFEDILFELGPLLEKSGHDIRIIGHTDSTPFSSDSYRNNWTLSYARANNVREVLNYLGMNNSRFVAVSGMADSQLLDEDNARAAVNRRVELLVLHKYEEMPVTL
ncbi:hypothetical protein GZ77_08240 [Endozoicomonas montiporae]|uniref:OmpA-like domain-containing protein n=2 Tax=Endozoicomonas montiporae TaxID=1027273 RepID=A0A081N7E4_9GAMM|nr:hypothetical protein GZ77_08240 [Endozoicomonas montiporae]